MHTLQISKSDHHHIIWSIPSHYMVIKALTKWGEYASIPEKYLYSYVYSSPKEKEKI